MVLLARGWGNSIQILAATRVAADTGGGGAGKGGARWPRLAVVKELSASAPVVAVEWLREQVRGGDGRGREERRPRFLTRGLCYFFCGCVFVAAIFVRMIFGSAVCVVLVAMLGACGRWDACRWCGVVWLADG